MCILFFSANSLFHQVHCFQGCTAKTLTGPLWGVILWFYWWGSCTRTKYPLVYSPHPKIDLRVNISGIPPMPKVWQTCDGLSRVSSNCTPHEHFVQAQHDVQANTQANLHIKGTGKDVILPYCKTLVPQWELVPHFC